MTRFVFALSIGVAAALLFIVQPLVGRLMLPVVGGSTAVWSATLVFFQAALLGGYAVAHAFARTPRRLQPVLFVGALVVAGAVTLPFALSGTVPDWASPEWWVLRELAVLVGAPFVVLSAASPLLQRWYSQLDVPDAAQPYRLYSASNAGSILGLLAYPLVVEPTLTLRQQAFGWAFAFAALVFLIVGCAALSRGTGDDAEVELADTHPPDRRQALWWLVCAAVPSALLVTMTASITADIAPVPLLWVVPLVVYLASHVWVFSSRAPREDRSMQVMLAVAVPYTGLAVFDLNEPWWLFTSLALFTLGAVAVAYHGELVRTRPHPRHLTGFYLWTAVGGVVGGFFATFVAPRLFDTLLELPLELAIALLLLPIARRASTSAATVVVSLVGVVVLFGMMQVLCVDPGRHEMIASWAAAAIVVAYRLDLRLGMVAITVAVVASAVGSSGIGTERSPYGRYRIVEVESDLGRFHQLVVGRVVHGTQSLDERLKNLPLSYHHPAGPVGQALKLPAAQGPIGVLGLGMGGIAGYSRADRSVTFFEIDPLVVEIALNPDYFTQLADCGSNCRVEIGDGRIALRGEEDDSFGALVMDAFSGDAVPTHLLTVEAFELYRRKLRPGGIILLNVSNSYIDVGSVVANAGAAVGLRAVRQDYWPRTRELQSLFVESSDWIALSDDPALIESLAADPRWTAVSGDGDAAWTDDWQNLFAYYQWR